MLRDLRRFLGRKPLQARGCSATATCPVAREPAGAPRTLHGSPKPFGAIPGPRCWPIVKALPDFTSRFGDDKVFAIAGEYYKEFGTVVRVELPMQTPEVWLYDPRDMLLLFRSEGPYPDGPTTMVWPVQEFAKRRGGLKLSSQGEEWRQHRRKLNPGLFSLSAAGQYVEQLTETARDLSKHLPKHAHDLNVFSKLASFDLFCAAVLGKSLRVISEDADPRNVNFAFEAAHAFQVMGDLMWSPFQTAMHGKFETALFKDYMRSSDVVRKVAKEIVAEIMEDPESLKRSYLKRLMEGGSFSPDEASVEVVDLLGAGVDTTGTTLGWFIYDLARNPEAQKKAASEVLEALGPDGDFKAGATLPYFKGCYRESLRLSPIGNTGTFRTAPKDLEIGGYSIPRGTRVSTISAHMLFDPKYVDDPLQFVPERWLPEAVQARKGTKRELVDHKLLAANFGFGPRMCLGARLAKNELFAMVSRLLVDWHFEVSRPAEKVVMHLLRAPEPSPGLRLSARTPGM